MKEGKNKSNNEKPLVPAADYSEQTARSSMQNHIQDNRSHSPIQAQLSNSPRPNAVVQRFSSREEIDAKAEEYRSINHLAGDDLIYHVVEEWLKNPSRDPSRDPLVMQWALFQKGVLSTDFGKAASVSSLEAVSFPNDICHSFSGHDPEMSFRSMVSTAKPGTLVLFTMQAKCAHSGKFDGKSVIHTASNAAFTMKTPFAAFQSCFPKSEYHYRYY